MPWLAAPFRPFYLLGAGYGALLMALAGLGFGGIAPGAFPMAWHGHEMVFGFAMAIIAGTVLTALPTWAGTAETRGALLAALVALWFAARMANALAAPPAPAALPWPLPAALDAALPLALAGRLAPQPLRLPQRRWRMVLVVFAALAAANVAWHAAVAHGDAAAAARACAPRCGSCWCCSRWPGACSRRCSPPTCCKRAACRRRRRRLPLEGTALLCTVAAAAADLGTAPASRTDIAAALAAAVPAATLAANPDAIAASLLRLDDPRHAVAGALALAAAAVQAFRVARWRGWQARGEPLVLAMHLGFAWLVFALVLAGATHFGWIEARVSWLHAFTAGALGSMMLGLMTRVALRHTGRELRAPRWLPLALAAVSVAAALRIAAPWLGAAAWTMAALLWALAMAAWWMRFAGVLVRPSRA
ncbi:MAG: NnrS family protein [Rubrivivax sp.]